MKFGTYSYTSARVKAMKSLLLTREDYIIMRKMGLNEMIRFLEEREYKKEVDKLSSENSGMELINLALNESLSETINKLKDISVKESHTLIDNYAMKWVVNNIKIILRTKDQKLIKKAVIPIQPTTYEFCEELAKKNKEEFLTGVRKVININENFKKFYEENDLIGMENELDKIYYSNLLSLSKELEDNVLSNFYSFLIELMDIKNIIKLKSMEIPNETISELIIKKNELTTSLIDSNMEDSLEILKESKYAKFVEGIDEDITKLENNIEKYLLQYSFKLMHMKPISIAPIFGYLLSKEIEVRNLKLLVNSKAVKLEENFVEENLIIKV